MAKKNNTALILWIVGGALLLLVLMSILWYMGTYNTLVGMDETVQSSWANVEAQYQRRADLVPNLIATVQGAADFEQETQTQIAELRTAAVAARQAYDTATSQEEKIAAANEVDQVATSFRSLNINVENYPQLRATENFAKLQDELAGTENRISVERIRYNNAVREFNTKIRSFPATIVASNHGFERHPLFEAASGAETAPVVSFN